MASQLGTLRLWEGPRHSGQAGASRPLTLCFLPPWPVDRGSDGANAVLLHQETHLFFAFWKSIKDKIMALPCAAPRGNLCTSCHWHQVPRPMHLAGTHAAVLSTRVFVNTTHRVLFHSTHRFRATSRLPSPHTNPLTVRTTAQHSPLHRPMPLPS